MLQENLGSSHITKLSTFVPEYEVCCIFLFAHHSSSFVFVAIASVSAWFRLDCPRLIFLPPIVFRLLDRTNESRTPTVDTSAELPSLPSHTRRNFHAYPLPIIRKNLLSTHHQDSSHSNRYHLPCIVEFGFLTTKSQMWL